MAKLPSGRLTGSSACASMYSARYQGWGLFSSWRKVTLRPQTISSHVLAWVRTRESKPLDVIRMLIESAPDHPGRAWALWPGYYPLFARGGMGGTRINCGGEFSLSLLLVQYHLTVWTAI